MLNSLESSSWHCQANTMSRTTKSFLVSLMLLSQIVLIINSHHVGQHHKQQPQQLREQNEQADKQQLRQRSDVGPPTSTTTSTATQTHRTREISCDDCEHAIPLNESTLPDKQQAAGSNIESQFIVSPTTSDQYALHFGAKLSIFLLSATILLVALATYVDLQTTSSLDGQHDDDDDDEHQSKRTRGHFLQRKSFKSSANGGRYSSRDRLRDHRSLSLSSSCSSSLFCSANSIASSSAPILAATSSASQHLNGAKCKQRPQVTANHYESNLQLHFNQEQTLQQTTSGEGHHNQLVLGDDGSISRTSSAEHADNQMLDTNHLQNQWPRLDNERWATSSSSSPPPPTSASIQTVDDCAGRLTSLKQVAKQLLLAFSLRQSARQIFLVETTAPKPSTGCDVQQNHCHSNKFGTSGRATNWPNLTSELIAGSVSCHRSRVSSLSSINEHQQTAADLDSETSSSFLLDSTSSCPRCGGSLIIINQQTSDFDANQDANQTNAHVDARTDDSVQRESIDSLHGLRFLSMIWVIVIHSYDFAIRWMMFTNRSMIDGIYTTIASQLLANGSFACDSFFFAGGFLLPYLAFQKRQTTTTAVSSNEDDGTKQTNNNNNNNTNKVNGEATSDWSRHSNGNGKISPTRSACSSPPPVAVVGAEQSAERQQSQQVQAAACTCNLLSSNQLRPQIVVVVGPHLILNNNNGNNLGKFSQQAGEGAKLNTNEQVKKVKNKNKIFSGTQMNYHMKQQQQQERETTTLNKKIKKDANSNTITTTTTTTTTALKQTNKSDSNQLSFNQVCVNILHRYVRMMPLMMAIIGLSATLLRYLGEGVAWRKSTVMYDQWCRKNWWVNMLFLHNFVNRENMCLSHSWYSAVDIQLFLVGQLIMFVLFKSRRLGLMLLFGCLFGSQIITATLTLLHHLPAVPLVSSVDEQTMNLYYGVIYIKPYCRASPYLIGILLAYLMRTTSLGQVRLKRWQVLLGWTSSLSLFALILFCMQPAMNGHSPSELQSAAYSSLSRPLWACATGWMIFACMTNQGGLIESFLSAKCFIPFSRLTYPAFLIHPIVMAIFYGSRESSFHFSHYLMLYLILGNIVITYACAFVLAALFELPLLSVERVIKRQFFTTNEQKRYNHHESSSTPSSSSSSSSSK